MASADSLPDASVPGDAGGPEDGASPADLPPPCSGVAGVSVAVSGIPEDTLGTIPGRYQGKDSAFHWAVPPVGWTVEVRVTHGPGWCAGEAPTVYWGSQEAAGLAPLAPGALAGQWEEEQGGAVWRARVDAPLPGGEGIFALQVGVGQVRSAVVPLEVHLRSPGLDPFDEVDRWVVTFSRDLGQIKVKKSGSAFQVETVAGPDGQADFADALQALGFLGGDAAFNAAMLGRFKARIRTLLHTFYLLDPATGAIGQQGVRVRFAFEGDAGVPPPSEWQAEGWSRIAVGGEDPTHKPGGPTFFGRAQVDWHNQKVNDDTAANLGVFTTSLVRMVLSNVAGAALLKAYLPAAAGGKPFGSQPGDSAMLDPTFDPEKLPPGEARDRGLRFGLVFRLLSLAIASVTAHEIGHSLGLVKPGLPPKGMLADVKGPWAVQLVGGGHIDAPGFNLMQTGSSFALSDLLGGLPRFAPTNLAYLRRQILML